ncbi:flagellar hook-basal body complex protein FliE [Anaerosolibacter carboniphilus]|uniref:Flagellar hook-basal body complex protein FliE n=1 Tax=Anaerosolibacter carboniphilus TaxID=1417629 RepID=A0A841KWT2_9FIRM|nr:flagellar hook-basal body complex protein FliE [Anaerosolibacter carboniphilus]MBB6216470.1 flagellar hook-basal body complex protein FliE [Anaerosolibacter carboniphilus]
MKINNVLSIGNNDLQVKENKPQIDFGGFLKDEIGKVNELELQSQQADEMLAIGETENIHEVMIAAQKAEIALQFTMEVKNKIMEAYKEIMRLPL